MTARGWHVICTSWWAVAAPSQLSARSADLTGDCTRPRQSCGPGPYVTVTVRYVALRCFVTGLCRRSLQQLLYCHQNYSHLLSLMSTIYLHFTRFTHYFKYKLYTRYSLFSTNCSIKTNIFNKPNLNMKWTMSMNLIIEHNTNWYCHLSWKR